MEILLLVVDPRLCKDDKIKNNLTKVRLFLYIHRVEFYFP